MILKVLMDNNTYIDRYYLGEPAVSYYIEDGSTKILFDMGCSDAFMLNAEKMGIDLTRVDIIVLSHGHDDHTKGLKYYRDWKKEITLVAHPDCFNRKEDETGLFIGSPLSKEELMEKCTLQLSDKPVKISENIYFLGEIPVAYDFEKRKPIGKTIIRNRKEDDFLKDDSAMVYKSSEGLFIITGCSHSGICNIIEYAKKVCGDDRVLGVIGGFHLFERDEQLFSTIEYFKDNSLRLLYPCHCVSLEAKIEMGKELDVREVGVGLELEI